MESDHRLRENPNLRHPSGFQTNISAIHVSKSSLCGYICKQCYRVEKHVMYVLALFHIQYVHLTYMDKLWNTFNMLILDVKINTKVGVQEYRFIKL